LLGDAVEQRSPLILADAGGDDPNLAARFRWRLADRAVPVPEPARRRVLNQLAPGFGEQPCPDIRREKQVPEIVAVEARTVGCFPGGVVHARRGV